MRDKTLLLIEDNPDDVALTLRALKKNKMDSNVVVANDGEEALDYLFARGEHEGRDTSIQPEVILLDLKLPKVDGIEVLKQLRANKLTKYLPVVVLSSSIECSDIVFCSDLGANSYVRKPVDFIEFTDTVRQLGQYWLMLNQTATA